MNILRLIFYLIGGQSNLGSLLLLLFHCFHESFTSQSQFQLSHVSCSHTQPSAVTIRSILLLLRVPLLTPHAALQGGRGYDLPIAVRTGHVTQQKYAGDTGRQASKKQGPSWGWQKKRRQGLAMEVSRGCGQPTHILFMPEEGFLEEVVDAGATRWAQLSKEDVSLSSLSGSPAIY